MPQDDQQNKVGARISLDISPAQKQLLQLSDDLKKTFTDSSINTNIDQLQNKISSLSQSFSEVQKQLNSTNTSTSNTFIQNTQGQLVTLQNALKDIQLSFKEGKLAAEDYLSSINGLRQTYADDFSTSNASGFKNDLLLRNAVLQAQKELSSLYDFELESERNLAQQEAKIQAEKDQMQATSINNQIRQIRDYYNLKQVSAQESLDQIKTLLNEEYAYFEENEQKKTEAMKLQYKIQSDLAKTQQENMQSGSIMQSLSKMNTGFSTTGMIAGMVGFSAVMGMYENMVQGMKDVENGAAGLHQVFEDQITSEDQLNIVTNDFIGIAKKYGESINQVMEGSKLWGRQYKDIDTALTLTNSSTLLSVVDNVKLADSNRGLEATMNAMGLAAETQSQAFANSMRIVDSWSNLAHKASVSATDLVQATERAAGAAHTVGVNFDQLQALITSGVRNTGLAGENIGNMLKSLFSSLETEKSQKALQDLNISLTQIGENGQKEFRPVFDVLLELSQKLQTADQSQQKLLETISGGKFQYSKVASMLSDYKTIIDAYATSINSAGAAQQYAQVQMNTLSRDIQRLKDTFAELASQTDQNGLGAFLKGIVVGLTDLITGLEQMPPAAGQTLLVIGGLLVALKSLTAVMNTLNPLASVMIATFQKIAPAMETAVVATEAETAAFTTLDVVSGGLALAIGAIVTGIGMYAMSSGQATDATKQLTQAKQEQVGIAQQEYNLAQQKQSFMDTAIKQEQALKKAMDDTHTSAQDRQKIMNDMVDLYHAVGKATGDEALQQVDASNIKNHSLSSEQQAIAQLVEAKKQAYEASIEANKKEIESDIARTNQLISDMNTIIDGLSKETQAKLTEMSFWDQAKVAFLEGGMGGTEGFNDGTSDIINNAVNDIEKNSRDKQLKAAQEKLTGYKAQLAQDQYKLASLNLDSFHIDTSGVPDYKPAIAVPNNWDSQKTKTKKPSASSFALPYRNEISGMQEDLSPFIQKNQDLSSTIAQLTSQYQTYSDMLKNGASDTQLAANETDLYQQRISALKDHQNALHETNDQLRSDMAAIKEKMNNLNPTGADVTTLSQGQQDALKSLSSEYDKLSKQADQNSAAWGKDQKDITTATLDWLNAIYQLDNNGLKPLNDDLHLNANDLKTVQGHMQLMSTELQHNGNDMQALKGYVADYHQEITLLDKDNALLSQSNQKLRDDNEDLRNKMSSVKQLYDEGKISSDAYNAAIQSLNTQIMKNTDDLSQNTDKTNQNNNAKLTASENMRTKIVDNIKSAYEAEKNYESANLDAQYKQQTDAINDQVTALQNQKNAIDQVIQSLQQQWNQQKANDQLADYENQRTQIMSQRNQEIIGANGQISYTYDVTKVTDLDQKIADQQTQIAHDAQIQQLNDQKSSIDQQIQNLNTQKQAIQDTYNQEKQDLDNYWQYKLSQENLNQEADNLILQKGTDAALATTKTFANQMIQQYNSVEAAAKAAAAAMASTMGAQSVGDIGTSSSSGGFDNSGGGNMQGWDGMADSPSTPSVAQAATGAYIPPGKEGLVYLHQNEIVLNSPQVDRINELLYNIPRYTIPSFQPISMTQTVQIDRLEFPNVRTAEDAQSFTTSIAGFMKQGYFNSLAGGME